MLYTLDTDHISLLQRGNLVVKKRLSLTSATDCAITMISLSEQFRGWWNEIARSKNEREVAQNFQFFQETVEFYLKLPLLP